MKEFNILSHNVFWFQGFPSPVDRPPELDVEVLRLLCAMYQDLNPDVICLQEIQSEHVFREVCRHLGMTGFYCEGKESSKYGGAIFWHPHRGRQILDSRAIKARTQRMWQIAEVIGTNACLRICNVHLPSGSELGLEQAATQRLVEIKESVRSVETGPDIILGDFNEAPPGPVSNFLNDSDYVDSAVLTDSTHCPTHIRGGRGDIIWVKKKLKKTICHYNVVKIQDFECSDGGKQYLSDHLPLRITVDMNWHEI